MSTSTMNAQDAQAVAETKAESTKYDLQSRMREIVSAAAAKDTATELRKTAVGELPEWCCDNLSRIVEVFRASRIQVVRKGQVEFRIGVDAAFDELYTPIKHAKLHNADKDQTRQRQFIACVVKALKDVWADHATKTLNTKVTSTARDMLWQEFCNRMSIPHTMQSDAKTETVNEARQRLASAMAELAQGYTG